MNVNPRRLFLSPLLGVALLTPLSAAPVTALVHDVKGMAEFAAPGSASFAPLKVGQTLPIGSTVRTGDDGTVVLVTTPGSAVDIGNDSVMKINDLAFSSHNGAVTERKARLKLTSGVISAMIDPSTPKITDFKIQTPQGVAAARGTFYAVMIRHGKTYVSVDHGKVGTLAEQ
jgi:hypothetical protein